MISETNFTFHIGQQRYIPEVIYQLIEEEKFYSITGPGTGLVLVDFYADWCEPCKWLDTILKEIEQELEGKATILQVDIEQFTLLRDRFHIKGIPVLILFKDGVEVWRMNGFTLGNELVATLNSFM